MPSVLFVCLGNICRSPAAEGILRHLVEKDRSIDVFVQSCGTGDWHVGQLPDQRMRHASQARGIVLSSRAQKFDPVFLDAFDYILAVDHEILEAIHFHATTMELKSKIHLVTDFSSIYKGLDIPDPYYGGPGSFDHVLDMLEDSCNGLIKVIKEKKNH